MARKLQISPRTIEVHRANMMGKLGASHVGEAISIALYSGFNADSNEDAIGPFVIPK
jgi:DNA-binding CsgD family transcriptional regulator